MVEHQPSKLRVAGSSPVARFFRTTEEADKAEGTEAEEKPTAGTAWVVSGAVGYRLTA